MGFDDRDAGRRDVEGDIRSVLRCQSPEWTTVDSNKDGQDFQLITLNRKKKSQSMTGHSLPTLTFG